MQHRRFVQLLQVTNVLAQVQLAGVRLLNVIVIDVHLLAIMLQLY